MDKPRRVGGVGRRRGKWVRRRIARVLLSTDARAITTQTEAIGPGAELFISAVRRAGISETRTGNWILVWPSVT